MRAGLQVAVKDAIFLSGRCVCTVPLSFPIFADVLPVANTQLVPESTEINEVGVPVEQGGVIDGPPSEKDTHGSEHVGTEPYAGCGSPLSVDSQLLSGVVDKEINDEEDHRYDDRDA